MHVCITYTYYEALGPFLDQLLEAIVSSGVRLIAKGHFQRSRPTKWYK